jgi:hypothetical protein
MAQLSRPYQIALGALALFALVWLLALRGHSSGSESSGSGSSAPAPTAAQAKKVAAPTPVYHGAAPGVEGLTRAVNKAHGAVAQSQQNEKQLQEKSAQASSSAPAAGTTSTPSSTSSSAATHSSTAHSTAAAHAGSSTASRSSATSARHSSSTSAGKAGTQLPTKQVQVEKALAQGKIAVVLFWNPKGADDEVVHLDLKILQLVHSGALTRLIPNIRRLYKREGFEVDKPIAVFEAEAKQVTAFGSITRNVQVNQTPTILIINKRGQTTTLTGLTDVYSIEQAIEEALHS